MSDFKAKSYILPYLYAVSKLYTDLLIHQLNSFRVRVADFGYSRKRNMIQVNDLLSETSVRVKF